MDSGIFNKIAKEKEIIEQLEVMEFVENSEGDAIRIFQTVNDRGKPLSNMEKAKSLLIYFSNRYLNKKLDNTINDHFSDIFEIYDRIYIKDYGDGKQKRMYYTDKELSELNIDKKDFDTLALQRELSNRGYKLPKSTKQDGSLDGIWGDETKNALLEYRKSQNKNKE